MRTIERTAKFRKDFRRLFSGMYGKKIDALLVEALTLLANDKALSDRYKDHALVGTYKDCRDCHLKPDIVLIYRKVGKEVIELVRIGSHSELGL